MTRVHRSQICEILLQLTDLKNRLHATYWSAGENMSAREEVAVKRALDEINNTITILTGII